MAGFYAGARWLLVPIDTWMTTRAIKFRFWSALWAGAEPLPLALAAGGAAYGLQVLLTHAGAPTVVRLLVDSAVIVVVYGGLLRLVSPSTFAEISASIRSQLHR